MNVLKVPYHLSTDRCLNIIYTYVVHIYTSRLELFVVISVCVFVCDTIEECLETG